MRVTNENSVLTAYLTGEIDHHTARPMRERIDTCLLTERPRELLLDFSGVTFMDSSGVGLVIGRYKNAQMISCKTAVCGLKERDKRIMLLSGLKELIEFR